MRLSVVEDEPAIAAGIRLALSDDGHAVDTVADGGSAVDWALAAPYGLVILDVILPGMSGLDVCQELRRRGFRAPILMLTALTGVNDRVGGLDRGADDYLGKPFAIAELKARIRALLRRSTTTAAPTIRVGDSSSTRGHWRSLAVGGQFGSPPVSLHSWSSSPGIQARSSHRSRSSRHFGRLISVPGSNVVEVYIRSLRRKVDDGRRDGLIETVRGAGYRLARRTPLRRAEIAKTSTWAGGSRSAGDRPPGHHPADAAVHRHVRGRARHLLCGLLCRVRRRAPARLRHRARPDRRAGRPGGVRNSDRARGAVALVADLVAVALVSAVAWILARRTLAPVRDAQLRQQRFVADASHETRNPLTAIKTVTSAALERERSADELRDTLVSVDESVDRLIRITGDLLLLARTNDPLTPTVRDRVDLSVIVSEVVEAARTLPGATRIRVTLEPDLPVEIDPVEIERVGRNLIENALRHGGDSATVSVRTRSADGEVMLEVIDDGRGSQEPTCHGSSTPSIGQASSTATEMASDLGSRSPATWPVATAVS